MLVVPVNAAKCAFANRDQHQNWIRRAGQEIPFIRDRARQFRAPIGPGEEDLRQFGVSMSFGVGPPGEFMSLVQESLTYGGFLSAACCCCDMR